MFGIVENDRRDVTLRLAFDAQGIFAQSRCIVNRFTIVGSLLGARILRRAVWCEGSFPTVIGESRERRCTHAVV